MSSEYLKHLQPIADADVQGLLRAELSYGDSWKKRGGVGAYMMACRKFDRLEMQLQKTIWTNNPELKPGATLKAAPFDIFAHAEADTRPEGIIDDIRDLRRYLLLVEAELIARGTIHGTHRDNQP